MKKVTLVDGPMIGQKRVVWYIPSCGSFPVRDDRLQKASPQVAFAAAIEPTADVPYYWYRMKEGSTRFAVFDEEMTRQKLKSKTIKL